MTMGTLWGYWITTKIYKRCYHWPFLWKRKTIGINPPFSNNGDPYYIQYIKYEVHYTNKFCGAWCSYPVELDPGLNQVIKIMWNKYFNNDEKRGTESINGTKEQ